jgi:DNA polymerase zeta
MNDDKEPFRLRLVYRDHIMIKPDSQLDLRASFIGRPLTRAPVIRLFGVTPASQRACLLVHRYMPYFYVDLHGTGLPAVGESNDVFLARFAQLVDDCLQGSIQNNNNTDDIASNQRAFVADMSMDLATPFYGYHESQHTFVKISLADPSLIKRVRYWIYYSTIASSSLSHIYCFFF